MGKTSNCWSLQENDLSSLIECFGEKIDNSASLSNSLAKQLDEKFTDPIEEYCELSKTVENVLLFRDSKHSDLVRLSKSLKIKQELLNTLVFSETEAQKISSIVTAAESNRENDESSSLPTKTRNPLTSALESDPQSKRRNAISKVKDKILSLEERIVHMTKELNDSNKTVQDEIDRYHFTRSVDLNKIIKDCAIIQRDYHRRCMFLWKDMLKEIQKL